jgi:hypothetical protein
MRGFCSIVLVVAACGGGKKGSDAPTPAKLCIDPAAPGGTSLSLTREDHPGLVVDGDDKGVGKLIEPDRVVHAVAEEAPGGPALAITAGAGCGAQPCNPQVVRVAGGTVAARAPLPHGDDIAAGGDYPFVVEWLSIEDGDNDGTPELWMSYQIVAPPEPAVGSTTAEHVAVFSLPDLTLRFTAQYASHPEASVLERCDGTLDLVDADCDSDRDLVLGQTCASAYCFELYDTGETSDGQDHTAECGTAPVVIPTVYLHQPDGTYRPA